MGFGASADGLIFLGCLRLRTDGCCAACSTACWMMLDYPAPGLGGSVTRARFALVVQWIGCRFPMPVTLVRVQPGVLALSYGSGGYLNDKKIILL